jgi:hypothetical protein
MLDAATDARRDRTTITMRPSQGSLGPNALLDIFHNFATEVGRIGLDYRIAKRPWRSQNPFPSSVSRLDSRGSEFATVRVCAKALRLPLRQCHAAITRGFAPHS